MVEFDQDACCMVVFMSAETATDKNYERLLEVGRKLREAALASRKYAVSIVVVTRDYPRPNATWRKRLAEARLNAAQRSFTAIVTSSSIVRGLLKTLHWIAPSDPMVEERIFASLSEAILWVEGERKEKLPVISTLYEKIQSALKKPK